MGKYPHLFSQKRSDFPTIRRFTSSPAPTFDTVLFTDKLSDSGRPVSRMMRSRSSVLHFQQPMYLSVPVRSRCRKERSNLDYSILAVFGLFNYGSPYRASTRYGRRSMLAVSRLTNQKSEVNRQRMRYTMSG